MKKKMMYRLIQDQFGIFKIQQRRCFLFKWVDAEILVCKTKDCADIAFKEWKENK